MQEGFACGQRRAAFLHDSFDVIGMNECWPLPALQIFNERPTLVEPRVIGEIKLADQADSCESGWVSSR